MKSNYVTAHSYMFLILYCIFSMLGFEIFNKQFHSVVHYAVMKVVLDVMCSHDILSIQFSTRDKNDNLFH